MCARTRPKSVPNTRNSGRSERKIGVKSTSYTALCPAISGSVWWTGGGGKKRRVLEAGSSSGFSL